MAAADDLALLHDDGMQMDCRSPRWVVWRQDDHGNRAQVAVFDTKNEAEQHAENLDARGHKQLYWVAEE